MFFHKMIDKIPKSAPTMIFFIIKSTLGLEEPYWKIKNMIFLISIPYMAKIKLFLTKYDKYPFQKRTHLYIWFSQLLEMIEIFCKNNLMLNSIEQTLRSWARMYCNVYASDELLKKKLPFRLAKKNMSICTLSDNNIFWNR